MAKRAIMIGLDSADPVQVRRLMNEGKMPNLKKLLDNGTANENLAMLGCLPSVTPPNWCSIATGAWPRTHGVTCYNNQTLGMSLGLEQANWDSGNVTAEFIWETFSKAGKRNISLNYCEAWPPRIPNDEYAVCIDGSGVIPFLKCNIDYQKVVTLKEGDFPIEFKPHSMKANNKDCIIMGDQYDDLKNKSVSVDYEDLVWALPVMTFPSRPDDPESTGEAMKRSKNPTQSDQILSPLKNPANWSFELPSDAMEATVVLAKGTIRRFLVVTASDGKTYDTVTIYKNKKTPEPLGQVVGIGNWSNYVIDYYMKNDEDHKVGYKIRLCDMKADGSEAIIYFSHTTDLSNLDFFYPQLMGKEMYEEIGPMTQFAIVDIRGDDYENHRILTETYGYQVNDWHERATHWMFKKYPDWQLFYVHLHSIDNYQHWFVNNTLDGSCDNPQHYRDLIDEIYTINDHYIGEMMKYLDDDTSIIVTSDHGCVPNSLGDHYPGIGAIGGTSTKVLGKLGYTVTYRDENGTLKIDWSKTRAVAMRSSHIYVNLKGRDPEGIVEPEDYHQLVLDIISDLYNYRDENGKRVIAHCFTRDEMEYLGMGGVHCGDILFQLVPTFCSEHANVFSSVHHEGWSMQNLCVMGGGGLKKGQLFDRPVRITDIVPTICHLTETPMSASVEGGVIYQALEGFDEDGFKEKRGDEWALPLHKRLIK